MTGGQHVGREVGRGQTDSTYVGQAVWDQTVKALRGILGAWTVLQKM